MEQEALRNKVAVVTGGSRGIGAAVARKLASMGAKVIICGRKQPDVDQMVATIISEGRHCEGILCDVSKGSSVEQFAQKVWDRHERVDILVNNAGVGEFGGPLHTLAPERWDRVVSTNLSAVYYMIRSFVPGMIRQRSGDIINISSIASKNALPNGAAYAATKSGLNGLSYSVAEELRTYNIRVSVVCPGSVDTDLSPPGGKKKERMLKPEDVAHVVGMIVTQQRQSFTSEVVLRPTQKP